MEVVGIVDNQNIKKADVVKNFKEVVKVQVNIFLYGVKLLNVY